MLRARFGYVAVAALCVALSGCGKKEPTGQVVAVLDKQEITATDLNNEMRGFTPPNAQVRKQAEQAALDQILARKALAAAAKKAKIDKTPGYAQQEQRVLDALLVQTWQESIAKSVPAPSKEEIDKFIASNPDVYGQHKIFIVDQVRIPRGVNPAVLQQLGAVKTMPGVTALLTQNGIEFRQSREKLDALALNPQIVSQIVKVPADDVFVFPVGQILAFNDIVETQVTPVPEQLAVRHATQLIKNQHTQEAIQRQFQGILAQARTKVKYAKAYEPAKPPAKGAAPAPKAAPAAPAAAPAAPAAAPPAKVG